MEIDRDEEPIWVTPLDKKIFQGNNKMKNRYTISKMDVLKAKNKKKNGKIEDQKNLINYIQKKTSSEKSKCEDEEQITESESDYDEDNISTKDKICSEYQNHNKFPKLFNSCYPDEQEECNNKLKSEYLKDSSFPQLLINYIKFLFNLLILVVAIWILFYFIISIKNDINIKYNEYLKENMKKISECYEQFKVNKCSSDIRIPALENTCKDWEACLNQDPDNIQVIMICAEVISEILNKFIDPLSIKTTIVLTVICTTFFIIIWKMNSIPSNKLTETSSNKEKIQNNKENDKGLPPLGVCQPHVMDSRLIGNDLVYQVAPAAIYPMETTCSMPISYPLVYPYPTYPVYQREVNSSHLTNSVPKYRKIPQNKSSKGYKIVKPDYNLYNPIHSMLKIKKSSYPPHYKNKVKEKYYYDIEDNDNYEVIDDYDYDDSYYEDKYGY
ncbi:hypothetical protein LY90DRAFT_696777 [Neocallimastix californiae]|uniref:Brl1/Brr6 domain-containing protein n=1 Tax=Neocallimastix californiae TaxID=1754190 RepID=A0A1Y2FUT6_9FUNG|nr:hypothetical protein LY90DRAFT_696777 [Neocallimastix californiae]|eukprot:ORY86465.1 hypothetical protein LY90DRAFT_696777 [Neocallimastix californiae]